MIVKTSAIILRTVKFKETSLILHAYSRELGLVNLIALGIRKSGKKQKYIPQPLDIIDAVIYSHEARDLQKLTEADIKIMYISIPTNPIKCLYGQLMMEICFKVIQEQEKNEDLYDSLVQILLLLDSVETGFYNLFIYFLLELAKFAGYQITENISNNTLPMILNYETGTIIETKYEQPSIRCLYSFIDKSPLEVLDIEVPKEQRTQLLQELFFYFEIHIPTFREIKTLEIFKEIFA